MVLGHGWNTRFAFQEHRFAFLVKRPGRAKSEQRASWILSREVNLRKRTMYRHLLGCLSHQWSFAAVSSSYTFPYAQEETSMLGIGCPPKSRFNNYKIGLMESFNKSCSLTTILIKSLSNSKFSLILKQCGWTFYNYWRYTDYHVFPHRNKMTKIQQSAMNHKCYLMFII